MINEAAPADQLTADSPLEDFVYECPGFPEGIASRALGQFSPDRQMSLARHWFLINFRPLPSNPTSDALDVGIPGQMVLGQLDGFGRLFTQPFGQTGSGPLTLQAEPHTLSGEGLTVNFDHAPTTAPVELDREFTGVVNRRLLDELGVSLQALSATWQFIPLPAPLPIELDGVARLQSEVDAARVRHDVDELETHLAVQAAAPPAYGQNYWPGAELLDDELRQELKLTLRTLREAAVAKAPPVEAVKQSVGRLVSIRNRVGQWLAVGGGENPRLDGADVQSRPRGRTKATLLLG